MWHIFLACTKSSLGKGCSAVKGHSVFRAINQFWKQLFVNFGNLIMQCCSFCLSLQTILPNQENLIFWPFWPSRDSQSSGAKKLCQSRNNILLFLFAFFSFSPFDANARCLHTHRSIHHSLRSMKNTHTRFFPLQRHVLSLFSLSFLSLCHHRSNP